MDNTITNESFNNLQKKAKNRLKKFESTKKNAIKKMLKNYNLTPYSNLNVKNHLSLEDINLTTNFRSLKTALIFPNEFIYSLVDAQKIPFGQLRQIYKKPGSSGKRIDKQRLVIKTNTYYVSIMDSKTYIHVICDEYYYNYKDYLNCDKDYLALLETEPADITTSAILLINGQLPFSYYRLDNNAEFNAPHPNKMENGKILFNNKTIRGPHEHMYDETYSIIYPSFPYSYDAKEIHSNRKDMPKNNRPPLLRAEIDFLVKNKLNLEDHNYKNENMNSFDIDKLNSIIDEKIKS